MSTPPAPAATGEQRPIPSDARLLWMASERAAPLFRTLDRAAAFGPLVVLLAILPAVVVFFVASCSEWDAAVSLRALELTGVSIPAEARPVVREQGPAGSIQPAALWIAAAPLRAMGEIWPMAILAASLAGGVALIALIWLFAGALSDRRLAFWSVLLAAFHPALMSLLVCPVPVSVALACGTAALWSHLRLGRRGTWTSIPHVALVVSGLAIAVLVAGEIALVVVGVIAIDALVAWMLPPPSGAQTRTGRTLRPAGQTLALRLAAAAAGTAIGFGVMGWISVDLAAPQPADDAPAQSATHVFDEAEIPIGPLWGLAAIGAGRLVRFPQRRPAARSSRANPRLLLVWLVVGVACLFWFPRSSMATVEAAQRFVLAAASVPMLITAGYAIEEAARRAVSGAWVLLAIALPLAMRLGEVLATITIDSPMALAGSLAAALVLAWLLMVVLRAFVPMSTQRRSLLMLAVLLAIAVDAADGIRLVSHQESRGEGVVQLMAQLRQEPQRDALVLLTDAPPPVTLVYALRATDFEAPMEIAPTWDEAASRLNRHAGGGVNDALAAAWGGGEAIGASSPESLRPTGAPLLFKRRALLLYIAQFPG